MDKVDSGQPASNDGDDIAGIVRSAGDEWDRECAEAYALGLFSVDRDTWIINALQASKYGAKISWRKLHQAIDEIDGYARALDGGYEYGLPTFDKADMQEMSRIIARELELEIEDDR